MARTQAQIKADILAAKAANADLNVLDSVSLVADWNMFMDIVVFCIWLHETAWDKFAATVNAIAARAVPGTAPWWAQQIKNFQYGDIIQILPDFSVGYSVVDPTKQIITEVAVVQLNGSVAIKCTTGGGPLTSDQQTGLQAYCNKIKPAGTDIVIISDNPDILHVLGSFYYDPEIPVATVKASMDAIVTAFLSNLPFNGIFYISQFYEALKGVTGYADIKLTTIEAKPNGGAFAAVNRLYNPLSGLMTVSAALSTTLTFVPNV